MKKMFSFIVALTFVGAIMSAKCLGNVYNITPKAPYVNPAIKPMIEKYKQANYIGAMQDFEEYVKNNRHDSLGKYYLALCYTQLGFRSEAQTLYKEIEAKDDNLVLTYYSKKAQTCLENPLDPQCSFPKPTPAEEEATDDLSRFIRSGRQVHPAAMDKITTERLERKVQEQEHIRRSTQNDMLQSNAARPARNKV